MPCSLAIILLLLSVELTFGSECIKLKMTRLHCRVGNDDKPVGNDRYRLRARVHCTRIQVQSLRAPVVRMRDYQYFMEPSAVC